jgi:hypothetical protein
MRNDKLQNYLSVGRSLDSLTRRLLTNTARYLILPGLKSSNDRRCSLAKRRPIVIFGVFV